MNANTARQHRVGMERWAALRAEATPCEDAPSHPYMIAKGEMLPGCGIASDGRLMISRYAIDGEMIGGQWIAAAPGAGGKFARHYSTGTPTCGTFYPLGTLEARGTVLVCEGAATGATLHRETGHAVACAMDCGNLAAVSRALRAKYPHVGIVLAGDDDRLTTGNPGRTKAIEAARAVGGRVLFPTFCCSACRCSDFNDVAACARRRGRA